MATAKKLPSGSWRCLVFDYTDANGKRHYKSFTCNDSSPKGKRKCEAMAAEWAVEKEKTESESACMTLSEAWDNYIALKSNVLSPSTIREYKCAKLHCFKSLMDCDINSITQQQIQSEINKLAKMNAPKTVKNKHGYLSAVLKQFRPDFVLQTKLPQKIKPSLYIPTENEVKKVLDVAKEDPDMYRAILLAAFGPMRRSEICGLKKSDIKKNVIHVQRAVVLNDNREWVEKTTKSVAGDRFIPLPDFVIAEISQCNDRVIELHPNNITDRFETILAKAGVPHFRFHDLRHFGASIQHAMGIPDAYIMQRGGWGSDAVLKNIYRHALSDQASEMNDKINNYFSNIVE